VLWVVWLGGPCCDNHRPTPAFRFKRGYLEQQLVRVLRQTLVPAAVYVWHNGEHQDIRAAVEAYRSGLLARTHNITPSPDTPPPLRVVHSSFNLRYHGRFTLPLLFGTEFTSIWDDDILPEPRFLSQCVSTSVAHGGALVGAAGRLIRSMDLPFTHVSALGDDSDVPQPLVVDYATLAYTFPTDHIRLLWAEPQLTFTTGEDISFAAALKRHGVRSVVVAQSALEQTRGNTASDDRFLEHASFTVQNSAFVRLGLICRQVCWNACHCSTVVVHHLVTDARNAVLWCARLTDRRARLSACGVPREMPRHQHTHSVHGHVR